MYKIAKGLNTRTTSALNKMLNVRTRTKYMLSNSEKERKLKKKKFKKSALWTRNAWMFPSIRP